MGEIMEQTVKTSPKNSMFSLLLLLALVLASCASTGSEEKKLENSLKSSDEAFNAAFKWGDYPEAAAFVPASGKQQFWAEVDRFRNKIRLVDYEFREVELKNKGASGEAIVYFQFWRLESPTLESVTFTQKWFYTAKDKQWRVSDTGFRAITGSRAVPPSVGPGQ